MTPGRSWLVLALAYLAFFFWYTPLGGPLDPAEIDDFLTQFASHDVPPERIAVWRAFLESDSGGDFAMFNAIEMRAKPLPVPGVPEDESSEQVLARYTRPFLGRALRSAAHPVLIGRATSPAVDLWGIAGAETWTTGGVVRYRSRRDLVEQALAVGPTGIHQFKTAAMQKTIAFPLAPWFQLGDPRLVLALVLSNCGLAWHLRCARRGTA